MSFSSVCTWTIIGSVAPPRRRREASISGGDTWSWLDYRWAHGPSYSSLCLLFLPPFFPSPSSLFIQLATSTLTSRHWLSYVPLLFFFPLLPRYFLSCFFLPLSNYKLLYASQQSEIETSIQTYITRKREIMYTETSQIEDGLYRLHPGYKAKLLSLLTKLFFLPSFLVSSSFCLSFCLFLFVCLFFYATPSFSLSVSLSVYY